MNVKYQKYHSFCIVIKALAILSMPYVMVDKWYNLSTYVFIELQKHGFQQVKVYIFKMLLM